MTYLSSTINALGVATVALVIALCFGGVLCIFYVLYFRWQVQQCHSPGLREFNSVWIVRILLILSATLWGLTEFLRLPLLRREGVLGFFKALESHQQISLCRAHTVLSFGISEPCFFLTALFLIQGSIRAAPFSPERRGNQKAVALILLCCVPLLTLQTLLVIICSKDSLGGRVLGLPAYFTRSHVFGLHKHNEVVCTYPLLNTVGLGLFSCVYNICFLWQGCKMLALAINKRLQIRICGLVSSIAILLPAQVVFMGMSVMSTPGNAQFELMAFLSFLAIVVCIIVGQGVLVFQPIADALAVRWVFKILPTSCQDVKHDPYTVPLFVFGNEEDYNPCSVIEGTGMPDINSRGEDFCIHHEEVSI